MRLAKPALLAAACGLLFATGCSLELAAVGESCTVASDCESDICERGLCQPRGSQPSCDDDALEPNDSRAEAYRVALDHRYAGLVLCPTDADWFVVALDAGTRLFVLTEGEGREPPAALTLRDAAGIEVAHEGTSSEGYVARQEYAITEGGDYSLEVGVGSGGSGRYTLLLLSYDPDAADCIDPYPAYDEALALEEDSPEAPLQGSVCPQGEYWTSVELDPGDALETKLHPAQGALLSFELYGAVDGAEPEPLETAVHEEEGAALLYAHESDTNDSRGYLLRVAGNDTATSLGFEMEYAVCRNDSGEGDNDAPDTAREAAEAGDGIVDLTAEGPHQVTGQLCPEDVDWIPLLIPPRSRLIVHGSYELERGGDLVLTVGQVGDQSVDAATVTGAQGELDLSWDPAPIPTEDTPVALRIEGADGTDAWGEYTLDLSVVSLGPECVNDDREPDYEPGGNPTVVNLSGLANPGELDGGVICPGDIDGFTIQEVQVGELIGVTVELDDPATTNFGLEFYGDADEPLVPIEEGSDPDAGSYRYRFQAAEAGEHELIVFEMESEGLHAGYGYTLTLQRGGACAAGDEEASEQQGNDTIVDAVELTEGADAPGLACAMDTDVYELTATPGSEVTLRLERTGGEGTLLFRLEDREGGWIDQVDFDGASEEITALLPTPPADPRDSESFYVWIELIQGESAAYTLSIESLTPPAGLADVQSGLFTPKCAGCHTAGHLTGLALDTVDDSHAGLYQVPSYDGGADGHILVVPYDASRSYLMDKLTLDQPEAGQRMPLNGAALSEAEVGLVRGWILSGAPEAVDPPDGE